MQVESFALALNFGGYFAIPCGLVYDWLEPYDRLAPMCAFAWLRSLSLCIPELYQNPVPCTLGNPPMISLFTRTPTTPTRRAGTHWQAFRHRSVITCASEGIS